MNESDGVGPHGLLTQLRLMKLKGIFILSGLDFNQQLLGKQKIKHVMVFPIMRQITLLLSQNLSFPNYLLQNQILAE